MTKTTINYLFPPDQIDNLPTWRFVLHFKAPAWFAGAKTKRAMSSLNTAEFKAVQFPFGLDEPILNKELGTVGVAVEVPPDRRSVAGSRADYESDVWKIYGNMLQHGFGDLFYEAIDWQQES